MAFEDLKKTASFENGTISSSISITGALLAVRLFIFAAATWLSKPWPTDPFGFFRLYCGIGSQCGIGSSEPSFLNCHRTV